MPDSCAHEQWQAHASVVEPADGEWCLTLEASCVLCLAPVTWLWPLATVGDRTQIRLPCRVAVVEQGGQ